MLRQVQLQRTNGVGSARVLNLCLRSYENYEIGLIALRDSKAYPLLCQKRPFDTILEDAWHQRFPRRILEGFHLE